MVILCGLFLRETYNYSTKATMRSVVCALTTRGVPDSMNLPDCDVVANEEKNVLNDRP